MSAFAGLTFEERGKLLQSTRDPRYTGLSAERMDYLLANPDLGAPMLRLLTEQASVDDEMRLVCNLYLVGGDRAHFDAVVRTRPDEEHDKPIRYKKGYVNDYGMSEYEYKLSEEYNLLVNVFKTIDNRWSEETYTTNDVRRFLPTVERAVTEWLFYGESDNPSATDEARAELVLRRGVRPTDLKIKYPLNAMFDHRSTDGEVIPEEWLSDCDTWGSHLEWDIHRRLVRDFEEHMGWRVRASSNVFQIDHYKLAEAIAATAK